MQNETGLFTTAKPEEAAFPQIIGSALLGVQDVFENERKLVHMLMLSEPFQAFDAFTWTLGIPLIITVIVPSE